MAILAKAKNIYIYRWVRLGTRLDKETNFYLCLMTSIIPSPGTSHLQDVCSQGCEKKTQVTQLHDITKKGVGKLNISGSAAKLWQERVVKSTISLWFHGLCGQCCRWDDAEM